MTKPIQRQREVAPKKKQTSTATEIRDKYRYTFPSNTVISTRLPDSASIFTAETWEEIKNASSFNNIVFTDSFSCFQAGIQKLEHSLVGMVIQKCTF